MIEPNDTKSEKGYWQKPNNYIRILTLAAIALYTGVQIFQTCLISSNNVISQRAFINFAFSQTMVAGDTSTPNAVNFIGSLTNSGNTPTKNLTFFFKCAPSAEDIQEPWSILHQGREKIEHEPLFVGGHASLSVGCSFTFQQMQDMAAGKLFGYLMLEAFYLDRFDKNNLHKTQAALMLTQVSIQPPKIAKIATAQGEQGIFIPAVVQTMIINRGKHNCADEECPE